MKVKEIFRGTACFIAEVKIPLLGCFLAVALTSFLTFGNLINPATYFGNHQLVNAWKIYQIEKNKLNPFRYDIDLGDLKGGRFVSYWDTPLPYFISLIFSRILAPFEQARFLAAVKLISLLNFLISYFAFYILLRLLKVSQIVAALVPAAFLSHRFVIFNLFSANMPGIWAIIVPLILFLEIYLGKRKFRYFVILGLSLGLSALQNPYYFAFAATLIFVPGLWDVIRNLKEEKAVLLVKYLVAIAVASLLVIAVKGPDIYRIYKEKLPDPQDRNYVTKQSFAYRPWYHISPPSGHFLSGYIAPRYQKIRDFIFEKGYIDGITLWNPEGNNTSYLGIANILIALILLIIVLKKGVGLRGLMKATPFVFSLLLGMLIFFRGDIFINVDRHIVFPWCRLQQHIPLMQLSYFAVVVILLTYVFIGVAFDKIKFRCHRLKTFIFIFILAASIIDSTATLRSTKPYFLDRELISYLQNNVNSNKMVIEIEYRGDSEIDPWLVVDPSVWKKPLSRDGRYHQVYADFNIYAPYGLSWFDYYRYDEPLSKIRNFETILTDKNEKKLKKMKVDEIVLIVGRIDNRNYWQEFLAPTYKSEKKVKLFKSGIVFEV